MSKVEIYTTKYCPYCIRAKHLLDKKGVTYTEFKVDSDNELYQEMIQRSHRTSVPQIFIDDFHVGGCDDMFMMEYNEQLDNLLFPENGDS